VKRAAAEFRGAPARTVAAAVWDCHLHIFDPAFPLAPRRPYTPQPATVADLRRHLARTGVSHAVLVQASPHGEDNAGVLAALETLGPAHRAVIAPAPDLDLPALRRLRDRGVRGLRLNPMGRIETVDAAVVSRLRAAARLAADAGVVLGLSASPEALVTLAPELAAFPCEIVLPHLAGLPAPGTAPDVLDRLRELLVRRGIWVKLSGFDRYGRLETPAVAAAVAFLSEALPSRLVWGSDWPHTPFHRGAAVTDPAPAAHRPVDDVRQMRALAEALGPALREQVFCRNAAALYD
jgi:predicted TIM-barrel fold metal-dependent hydrolase